MKKLLFRIAGIVAMLSAPLFISTAAHAANHTWTGAGTPNGSGNLLFSDAANWDVAPTTDGTATLVFPKNKASDKIYNDLTAGIEFAGIDFTVDGSVPGGTTNCPIVNTRVSGNAITLAGNVRVLVSPAGTTCFYYPTIALNITLSANVTVTGSSNGSPMFGESPASTLNMGTFNLALNTSNTSIYSNITGSGSIVISGTDMSTELSGDNSSYTGAITVNSGMNLIANGPKSLGSAATGTTVQSGASLRLCTTADPVVYTEPLTVGGKGTAEGGFTGSITNGSCSMGGGGGVYVPKNVELTGSVTLTANTEVKIADNLKISGPLSGSFTITAQTGGTGTLNIASSNNTSSTPNGTQTIQIVTTTYSDETIDNINVSQNNIVIVTGKRGNVDVTGTLKGTGTVGNITLIGGTLAPGMSPGCISSGNLDLSNGTYQVELEDLTACTEYDQTKVTGTVTLGGTLQIIRFNNMVPRINNSFKIIDNDGTDAVTGTFSGLAQGATTVVDGITYSISYTGGDGNDVVLVVTAVDSKLGAPNTGAHVIKSGIILPIFAILSAVAILGMNYIASKKK